MKPLYSFPCDMKIGLCNHDGEHGFERICFRWNIITLAVLGGAEALLEEEHCSNRSLLDALTIEYLNTESLYDYKKAIK